MANYEIIGQYPDTEVIGGAKVRDVQVIQAVTSPSEIYFEVRVPRSQASTSYLKYTAQSYRDIYETLAAIAGVADVQWSQRPTQAGNLTDWVTLYVESDSGESTGVIDIPFSGIAALTGGTRIPQLVAALNATEAA